MIVDKVSRLSRYAGLGGNFQTAFDFLARTDWAALPVGRTEVDGDRVYINVMDRVLTGQNPRWETHGKYADIQIIARGREIVGYAPPCQASEAAPYNAEKDVSLFEGEGGLDVTLRPGDCVILLPGEPHRPDCAAGAADSTKKLVVKVRVD